MPIKETYKQTIKLLREQGYRQLVDLLEKTYEDNPYRKGSSPYTMWQEQCAINLPILYLGSLYLHKYGENHGYIRYLFATRDCCHWHKVFAKMYPQEDVHYFRCSRNMFTIAEDKKRPEYKDYVKSLADTGAVYVDIHGTGKHMLDYFKANFTYAIACFFMSSGFDDYRELPKLCRRLHEHDGLHTIALGVNGSPIEMLNYDTMGTLQDYNEDGPVLDECEYDVKLVEPYHKCVQYFIDHLKSIDEKGDLDELREIIHKLFKPIRKSDMKPVISKYVTHQKTHAKLVK